MKKIIYNILILVFLLAPPLHSQTEPDSNNFGQEEDTTFVMSKSPWGAVLRSAIIPGLGQFYNESYWKVPLIFGAVAYFAFQWNNSNNKYLEYRDLYTDGLDTGDINTSAYLQLREFYKDERNLFAIFIGVI